MVRPLQAGSWFHPSGAPIPQCYSSWRRGLRFRSRNGICNQSAAGIIAAAAPMQHCLMTESAARTCVGKRSHRSLLVTMMLKFHRYTGSALSMPAHRLRHCNERPSLTQPRSNFLRHFHRQNRPFHQNQAVTPNGKGIPQVPSPGHMDRQLCAADAFLAMNSIPPHNRTIGAIARRYPLLPAFQPGSASPLKFHKLCILRRVPTDFCKIPNRKPYPSIAKHGLGHRDTLRLIAAPVLPSWRVLESIDLQWCGNSHWHKQCLLHRLRGAGNHQCSRGMRPRQRPPPRCRCPTIWRNPRDFCRQSG